MEKKFKKNDLVYVYRSNNHNDIVGTIQKIKIDYIFGFISMYLLYNGVVNS